ncbi:hypothetical protein AX17_007051 [Amanita inopinata Kibby_2008]|nr:hypothetical protein AX17_007051 [Amanita inopinata Kibby_2008]
MPVGKKLSLSRSELSVQSSATRTATGMRRYVSEDAGGASEDEPYTGRFFDKTPTAAAARLIYIKLVGRGTLMVMFVVLAVFSIYWGSLWKVPSGSLHGWIVDFDGGPVGQFVTRGLLGVPSRGISLTVVPATNFAGGISQLANAVVEEKTWFAITINPATSAQLNASLTTPNASYNPFEAITILANEGRNEVSFRNIIRPIITANLDNLTYHFATQNVQRQVNNPALLSILSTSPQTLASPISYTIDNLRPFNAPALSATIFVGLIYLTIAAFFMVVISFGARRASGIDTRLTLRSLFIVRLVSSFTSYFFISLCYSFLNLAFQINLSHKFGHRGFVIFWMLNWVGMTALGLALEALMPLLTPANIPFFLLTWIMCKCFFYPPPKCLFISTLRQRRSVHVPYSNPSYHIPLRLRKSILQHLNRSADHRVLYEK